MRKVKEYYLPIPEIGKLIVKATCKPEAVKTLEAMGHQVGCKDVFLLDTPNRKPKTFPPHLHKNLQFE